MSGLGVSQKESKEERRGDKKKTDKPVRSRSKSPKVPKNSELSLSFFAEYLVACFKYLIYISDLICSLMLQNERHESFLPTPLETDSFLPVRD